MRDAVPYGRIMTFHVTGIDADQLDAALDDGLDHAKNPIKSFVDDDGGWPLRCCLGDSAPGDEIAIIAWSPFPWKGAYAETGPVVVHTANCPGAPEPKLSGEFDIRPMVLRPYGFNQRIAYTECAMSTTVHRCRPTSKSCLPRPTSTSCTGET